MPLYEVQWFWPKIMISNQLVALFLEYSKGSRYLQSGGLEKTVDLAAQDHSLFCLRGVRKMSGNGNFPQDPPYPATSLASTRLAATVII
jgi:hypothetical protein